MTNVCRQNENTCDINIVPIVFVPGIMGSRLHFPGANAFWNPDNLEQMKHWFWSRVPTQRAEMRYTNPVVIMTDQTKEVLAETEQGLGWEGVVWDNYIPFLRFLRTQQFSSYCPVYAVGYDWRQSNRDSGDYLIQQVHGILGREDAESCVVITHSMGGLVARSACMDADFSSKVLGVIHVVQPVHGAPVLYRRFSTGVIVPEDVPTWKHATVLGDAGWKFRAIVSGMPGVTQLLPTNNYLDNTTPPAWVWRDSQDDHGNWTNSPLNYGNVLELYLASVAPYGLIYGTDSEAVRTDLTNSVREADQFHAWLSTNRHANTFAIYSTGVDTDMRTQYRRRRMASSLLAPQTTVDVARCRRPDGDGTVPETSGGGLFPGPALSLSGPDMRQFLLNGVEHGNAFNAPAVQNMVINLIKQII